MQGIGWAFSAPLRSEQKARTIKARVAFSKAVPSSSWLEEGSHESFAELRYVPPSQLQTVCPSMTNFLRKFGSLLLMEREASSIRSQLGQIAEELRLSKATPLALESKVRALQRLRATLDGSFVDSDPPTDVVINFVLGGIIDRIWLNLGGVMNFEEVEVEMDMLYNAIANALDHYLEHTGSPEGIEIPLASCIREYFAVVGRLNNRTQP